MFLRKDPPPARMKTITMHRAVDYHTTARRAAEHAGGGGETWVRLEGMSAVRVDLLHTVGVTV